MAEIECRSLRRAFGRLVAVDDVSLCVRSGENVVLRGRSGSGKTTLLRLIAGLERPDAGQIYLDGAQVSGSARHQHPKRRQLGMVFQGLALWPHMSVEAHLDFVLRPRCRSRRERQERRLVWLERVHLIERRKAFPHQLSGGERQRVALARALCIEPAILLLDEPMTGLDAELRAEVLALLQEVTLDRELTTLYVTHYPDEVAPLADRVLTMAGGKLAGGDRAPMSDEELTAQSQAGCEVPMSKEALVCG